VIFRPKLVAKIFAGQKTQTRRPVKSGELHCPYVVGKRYAVQPGAGKQAVARILIKDIGREQLGDIDAKGAQLEGFKRRDQFIDYWRELYGRVDEEQLVWVLTFELDGEMARFLAPSREAHDYTHDPRRAIDELEVVPESWRDPGAGQARERHRQERREQDRRRSGTSIVQQVRSEIVAADRGGVDIAAELAEIHRQVEGIRRKREKAA
jgi:hypothetical protein